MRLFIFFAMMVGFFIQAEYSIIRPVSNAVFITAYGSKFFPYAWLASVPLNLLIVSLYNKYLPRLGCLRMLATVAAVITSVNLFCCFFLDRLSWLPFFFYIWKEIYILLMFQQIWSVIHSVISFERAKYLYGIFFGVGALGAALGSLLPGFFAVQMGSESLLLMTAPLYCLLFVCYYFALKQTKEGTKMNIEESKNRSSLGALLHGMKMIKDSRYLVFILSIVVFMQVCSTLIDFEFNSLLEKTILNKDLRTEYTGKVFGMIHVATIVFQVIGSFLLVHFLGVKRSHFIVPLLLCLNALAFQVFPWFSVISFGFICIKSCDFSIFGIIKEMLYIPLTADEKFRAKAVIDIFAYRSSKALASFLILGLQWAFGSAASPVLNVVSIGLFVLWTMTVLLLFKQKPLKQPGTADATQS